VATEAATKSVIRRHCGSAIPTTRFDHISAVPVIDEQADTWTNVGSPQRGDVEQPLRPTEPLARSTGGVGHRLNLPAMVDRQDMNITHRRHRIRYPSASCSAGGLVALGWHSVP
jgi:hypothetical protein